jgi:hypothetical protein
MSVTLTNPGDSVQVVVSANGGNVVIGAVGGSGGSTPPPTAAGNVTLGTPSSAYNTDGNLEVTESYTPPGTLGTFKGVHWFAEVPDQQGAGKLTADGATPWDGTLQAKGNNTDNRIDLGRRDYDPNELTQNFDLPPVTQNQTIRLVAVSYSNLRENDYASSPSVTLAVTPDNGAPKILAADAYTANAIWGATPYSITAPYNLNGKLEQDINFSTIVLPTDPKFSGWEIWSNGWPGDANFYAHTGILHETSTTITVDAPNSIIQVTFWLRSVSIDATGTINRNPFVPGITPSVSITLGSSTGTVDLASAIAASIGNAMAILGAVLDVKAGGITEDLIHAFAVSETKLKDCAVIAAKIPDFSLVNTKYANLSVDGPKLALLAVDSAQLANSSVKATKIDNLAVGTAAIALLAVGTGTIALLAVDNSRIGNLAVDTINIRNGAVDTAQIRNLAITNGLIANAAINDAKISDLSAGKITAGTITAVTITALTCNGGAITGTTLTLNSNGITTTLNNATDSNVGAQSGLKIQDNTLSIYSTTVPGGHYVVDAGGNLLASINKNSLGNYGMLNLLDATGTGNKIVFNSNALTLVMGTGAFATQVLKTRITGWTKWTGTATRSGFATSTATLQNVAETLKALIDDLHNTAGHGLIGT